MRKIIEVKYFKEKIIFDHPTTKTPLK